MIQAGEGPRIVIKISRQFSGMGHEKKKHSIVTYLVQKSRKRKGLLSW